MKKKKEKNNFSQKIIVILGPTASGKSDLAVFLAKKFGGEVISADSRQVYKGMNLGTGKITKKEMQGIKHHLLDVASPKRRFTVSQFVNLAKKAIKEIFKKKKIPIICGGTAFYIKALTEGLKFPQVKPDWKLRKELEKKDKKELFNLLKKLDPERAKTIEKENPRRLIRAIEVVLKTGKKNPKLEKEPLEFPILYLGIKKDKEELKKAIAKRLEKRLKQGMIKEVKRLHEKEGLSWKRLESLGIEYKWTAKFLQGKTSYQEMVENIVKYSLKFAKKQMTWWKKDNRIYWVRNKKEAEKLVREFLNQ